MTTPSDKKRILIVDDDVDLTEMLCVCFDKQGYEVSVATHGEDAIRIVRESNPQVILLDIVLPGIDGYEVCREIRQTQDTSRIPIIFLSAKGERSDKMQGLELGADDYITKPFNIDEVVLRIRNTIDRAERGLFDIGESLLPTPSIVKDKLRDIQKSNDSWTLIDLKVSHLDAFRENYGNLAGGEVFKLLLRLLVEMVDELGTEDDLIGELGFNHYVIITYSDKAEQLEEKIISRFNHDVIAHYSSVDRVRQYIVLPSGEKYPLMTMSHCSTNQFPIEGIDLT